MARDKSMWRINKSVRNPGWLVLIGHFDEEFLEEFKRAEEFLEAFKRAVPVSDRVWNQTGNYWLFRDEHELKVQAVIDDVRLL
jgi:hypothetical protein